MAFFDKVKNVLKLGTILYYPGCVSKFKQKQLTDNYKKLLKKLGIEFITLEIEELCCGLPLLTSGYKDSFENNIEKNKLIFKNKNITKIITNCPACAKIFKKYYHIETEYIAETIANNIRKLEFEKENKEQEQIKDTISLHIPCYLMKNTELIKKVKKLLENQGLKIKELDEAFCCGTGHNPLRKTNLTRKISKLTLDKIETKKLITLCPLCYEHFNENNKNNLEIIELNQIFLQDDKKTN